MLNNWDRVKKCIHRKPGELLEEEPSQGIQHTIYTTVYSIHYTLYSIQFILYSVYV